MFTYISRSLSHTCEQSHLYFRQVYAPEDQGGEIIAYSVCTQKTCQNVTFANNEHRLPQVTSGLVPERCILGCNVTVQAFTRKGPSNKSSTLKITPYLESISTFFSSVCLY